MTQLLEQAFEQAKLLSVERQDELAQQIIRALADERWDALFTDSRSDGLLEQLADEALAEYRSGKHRLFDPATDPKRSLR
jgi:hypothetical protein